MDLVEGHICALENLHKKNNLGKGYSVLEIINIIKKVSGKNIRYDIVEKRLGDISSIYPNCYIYTRVSTGKQLSTIFLFILSFAI